MIILNSFLRVRKKTHWNNFLNEKKSFIIGKFALSYKLEYCGMIKKT